MKKQIESVFTLADVDVLIILGHLSKIFTPIAQNDKDVRLYLKTHFDVDVRDIVFDSTYFFEYKKTHESVKNKNSNYRVSTRSQKNKKTFDFK